MSELYRELGGASALRTRRLHVLIMLAAAAVVVFIFRFGVKNRRDRELPVMSRSPLFLIIVVRRCCGRGMVAHMAEPLVDAISRGDGRDRRGWGVLKGLFVKYLADLGHGGLEPFWVITLIG